MIRHVQSSVLWVKDKNSLSARIHYIVGDTFAKKNRQLLLASANFSSVSVLKLSRKASKEIDQARTNLLEPITHADLLRFPTDQNGYTKFNAGSPNSIKVVSNRSKGDMSLDTVTNDDMLQFNVPQFFAEHALRFNVADSMELALKRIIDPPKNKIVTAFDK